MLPASRSFKAELQRIVEFLNVPDVESKQLWDVLSALRGPDSVSEVALFGPTVDHYRMNQEDAVAKEATTEVIRHTIGLSGDGLGILISPDQAGAEVVREKIPNGHFKLHALLAFKTLGLDWDKVNQPNADGHASDGLGRIKIRKIPASASAT
jgi:hypothetical protein